MPLGALRRSEPFERIAIDLATDYPEDNSGNKHILVVVDTATRFVELMAIPDKTAVTIANELLKLFGRYGCPTELHSDRGGEFVNDVADALLDALRIERSQSVPHKPSTNGQAERFVQETSRHIRAITYDDQSIRFKWSTVLPILQRIINATIINPQAPADQHVTPVELLFAGCVTPDRHLFKSPSPGLDVAEAAKDYVAERRDLQQQMLSLINSSQHLTSRGADQPSPFEVGEHVLLAPPKRPVDKLSPKLRGPFIVGSVHGNIVNVADLQTGTQRCVHASRLREWKQRDGTDPATEAARTHPSQYVVERIHDHRRKDDSRGRLTKAKCEYLTEWEDFPDKIDYTWEPYSSIKHTDVLAKYLSSTTLL